MDVAGVLADVEVHWRRSAAGAEESASVVGSAGEDVLTLRDAEPIADVEVHWRASAEGAEESASVVEPASEDVLTLRDAEPIADPEAGDAADVASSE
jgi:hypothetical protein